MATKHKKMLVQEKKEILDQILTLTEGIEKIDASKSRLNARRSKLTSETVALARQLYEELERTNIQDQPIVYKGKVMTIGWTNVEIEPASKL